MYSEFESSSRESASDGVVVPLLSTSDAAMREGMKAGADASSFDFEVGKGDVGKGGISLAKPAVLGVRGVEGGSSLSFDVASSLVASNSSSEQCRHNYEIHVSTSSLLK